MKSNIVTFQLGKEKLKESFLETLEKTFKKHNLVKISVLKSASRNREEIKEIAEKICKYLKKTFNKEFTYRVIGYTINLRKWK